MRKTLFTLLMILILLTDGLPAANLAQEQRISERLITPDLVGEAHWLSASNVRFLTLLTKSDADRRLGRAILLHDAGDNADGAYVIGPLRRYLTDRGWDTLSLQLPRPTELLTKSGRDELTSLAVERLRAAVKFFNTQGSGPLVLVGHGLGAQMALTYTTAGPREDIRALVAIGLAAAEGNETDPVIQGIAGLQLPMLDLYGDRDRSEVLATAQARHAAAKRNQRKDYRQDRVMGADHHFSGLQESLQRRVASWLRRVAGD